ncbi:MAG: ECF-type sigma factor [Phycisphaerales bacterium]
MTRDPRQDRHQRADDATMLLGRIANGDSAAAEDLLPIVYAELRARAGAYFRGQPMNHTLQPTALVHEAYVKLVNAQSGEWSGRAHFCAVAATAMRQILVDHARRREAAARAREAHVGSRTQIASPSRSPAVDLLELDDAIRKLAALDERQAKLVELRFFGGMSNAQVADVLNVSMSTVEKEWRKVRAWMLRELSAEGAM